MAEQPENPYDRLYGQSQDTFHNSMAGAQHHPSQHSQPQAWPQQSYLPWQSNPAKQGVDLQPPPWQAQTGPQGMRHPNVGPAAPPWLSAEPVHSQGIPQAQQHPAQGSLHPNHTGNSACQASAALQAPSISPVLRGPLPGSQQWVAQETGDDFRQQPQKRPRVSSETHDHDGNNIDRLHVITSTMPDSDHGLDLDAGRQQEERKVVLIWDVDETLVLFLSLLDGSFARAFQQVLFLPSQLAQYHGLRCHT